MKNKKTSLKEWIEVVIFGLIMTALIFYAIHIGLSRSYWYAGDHHYNQLIKGKNIDK